MMQQNAPLDDQTENLLDSRRPQTKQVPAWLRWMVRAAVLALIYPLTKKIAGDASAAQHNNSTCYVPIIAPANITDDDPDANTPTSVFIVKDIFMALALTAYPLLRFAHNESADFSSFKGILIETSLLWACYLLETCFKPEIKDHCNIEVLGMIFAFSVVMLTVYSFRDPISRIDMTEALELIREFMIDLATIVTGWVRKACTDMTEALELIREFMIDLATIVTGRVRKACSSCSACGALSFFTEKHKKPDHSADEDQESQTQPEIIITSTTSAT